MSTVPTIISGGQTGDGYVLGIITEQCVPWDFIACGSNHPRL